MHIRDTTAFLSDVDFIKNVLKLKSRTKAVMTAVSFLRGLARRQDEEGFIDTNVLFNVVRHANPDLTDDEADKIASVVYSVFRHTVYDKAPGIHTVEDRFLYAMKYSGLMENKGGLSSSGIATSSYLVYQPKDKNQLVLDGVTLSTLSMTERLTSGVGQSFLVSDMVSKLVNKIAIKTGSPCLVVEEYVLLALYDFNTGKPKITLDNIHDAKKENPYFTNYGFNQLKEICTLIDEQALSIKLIKPSPEQLGELAVL
jgi:hypothetical protein